MIKPMIRKATEKDAAIIAHIHVRGWQGAYGDILSREKLDSLMLAEWEEAWIGRLKSSLSAVLLVEEHDIPRGFVAFGPYRDEGEHKGKSEIYAIYIDTEMKGKGFGTLLCKTACDVLKNQGFPSVALWVLEKNIRAHQFYNALGFSKTTQIQQVDLLDTLVQEVQFEKQL